MLEMLAHTSENELDCGQVDELLDAYAEAAAEGEDLSSILPQVRQPLALCHDCLDEFSSLVRMLKADRA
ncbi:MAG: hypothetical protein A2Y93_12310 [Chloroflexi bacterium RBG_13_68_17]|nr:MAG: hypothetical protein A2Y93_12310 [Chloroflexi bacterium RBG_13_68_17]